MMAELKDYTRLIPDWEVAILRQPIGPVKYVDPETGKYISDPNKNSEKKILTEFVNTYKGTSNFIYRMRVKLKMVKISALAEKEIEKIKTLYSNRFKVLEV